MPCAARDGSDPERRRQPSALRGGSLDRQSFSRPFGETVLETGCASTLLSEQPDRIVGNYAVGAAAVRHHVGAVGNLVEPRLEVG